SSPDPQDGGGVTLPFQRGWFSNNLFYNATNTNPGCGGVNSTGMSVESASERWQGTITGNGTTATFTAACAVQDWSGGSLAGTCLGQVAAGTVLSGGTGCVANGAITISAPNIAGGIQAVAKTLCTSGAISGVNVTQ